MQFRPTRTPKRCPVGTSPSRTIRQTENAGRFSLRLTAYRSTLPTEQGRGGKFEVRSLKFEKNLTSHFSLLKSLHCFCLKFLSYVRCIRIWEVRSLGHQDVAAAFQGIDPGLSSMRAAVTERTG